MPISRSGPVLLQERGKGTPKSTRKVFLSLFDGAGGGEGTIFAAERKSAG